MNDPRYLNGELIPVITDMKIHTEEFKRKISRINSKRQLGSGNSMYGTCWIHNDKESVRIRKDKLDVYLKDGWIKGRKLKWIVSLSG